MRLSQRQRVRLARIGGLSCWVIRFNPRPLTWWQRILVSLRTRRRPTPAYVALGWVPDPDPLLTLDIQGAMKFPTERAAEDFKWTALIKSRAFTRLQTVSASIAAVP